MLFTPPFFFDLNDDLCNGLWTYEQLIEMDQKFVAAVEQTFASGAESRTAARATYAMNGKRRADEIAIELAWRWLRENMDAAIDVSFIEVVEFVNTRCPGVPASQVRAGFEKRFARDGSWKEAPVGVKENTEGEQDAGRRLARERTEKFELEVEAGRRRDERARERLEREVEAGRRAVAKFG